MNTHERLRGIVRGRTIELSCDPGFPSGVEVEVILRPILPAPSVGGLARCAGELADFWTEEDDRILAEIQAARNRGFSD